MIESRNPQQSNPAKVRWWIPVALWLAATVLLPSSIRWWWIGAPFVIIVLVIGSDALRMAVDQFKYGPLTPQHIVAERIESILRSPSATPSLFLDKWPETENGGLVVEAKHLLEEAADRTTNSFSQERLQERKARLLELKEVLRRSPRRAKG